MCMLYLDFMYSGLARGGLRMQQVKKNYAKATELLIELASLQTSFVTLDDVIKMTNRRVNAIEHGMINDTVTSIAFLLTLATLDELPQACNSPTVTCTSLLVPFVCLSVPCLPHSVSSN